MSKESVNNIKVNWNEIEEVKNTHDDIRVSKKIYLEYLPKDINGRIKWKQSVGYVVPCLYNGDEYMIIIDDYEPKKQNLTINIIGYHKIDFVLHTGGFVKCGIGLLINNVYANPNYKYRQLVIDSIGVEETKKYTTQSQKKINIKCPNCGKVKNISLCDLTNQGLGCTNCSDGISYPEKIIGQVLNSLNIEYQTQYKINNYKYKYDFYLPKHNSIIEVHGEQHYKNGWKSYEEEHENDLIKYDLAVINLDMEFNKTYYIIDSQESNIEYIRNNIESCQFFQQFDLTQINWKNIDKNAQSSLKMSIIKYWICNQNITTQQIAELFKIHRTTVIKALKWGTEKGFCTYDAKKEMSKSGKITGIKYGGKHSGKNAKETQGIYCYLVKPNGMKWFEESHTQGELAKLTNISPQTINNRCKDGKPLAGRTGAKYDSKYIGSYVVLAEEYDLQFNKNNSDSNNNKVA